MDPRPSVIAQRLAGVKRIIAVSGSKGGIGKSSIACSLALNLSEKGYKIGLFDMDMSSPSDHVILGIPEMFPVEDKGLIAPEFHGLRFMSIIYFTGNSPIALRGNDISNAIAELLAVTLWHDLDFMILDMPPGIGDATLDVIRLIRRMEYLLITVSSRVAVQVVKKEISLLRHLDIPVIGLLENMCRDEKLPSSLSPELRRLSVPFLGVLLFDTMLEYALGNADCLLETRFSRQVQGIVPPIESFRGHPSSDRP